MVFITSQEYIDPYGKSSRNIINLETAYDYKMFKNDENTYTVAIIQGDMEKFLFKTADDKEAIKILANIFSHHAKNEPHNIYEIEAFLIPEVEKENVSIEELL